MINTFDDHVWLMIGGEGWAIRAIRHPILYLWRGDQPNIECMAIDMRSIDWNSYCRAAMVMIQNRYGTEIEILIDSGQKMGLAD